MKSIVERGATSQIEHFFIPDSSSTTGAGRTGLAHDTASLKIVVMRPGEASPTKYLQSAGNIETISTLGTYAAPTSGKCRFKEIDATDMPGWYEVQFADALYNTTSNRRSLGGIISGASNVAPTSFQILLADPVRGVGSPTALPNAVAGAASGLPVWGTITNGLINQTVNNTLEARLADAAHGGTAATLRLGSSSATPALNITNSGGDAVQLTSSFSGGTGLLSTGNGSGKGAMFQGGATGVGLWIQAGATSGTGLNIVSVGHAISAVASGAGFSGIFSRGSGTGSGMYLHGDTNGQGLRTIGGSVSGNAVLMTTTDGDGINITASGSGKVSANFVTGITLSGVELTLAIWAALTSALTVVGSIGKMLVDKLGSVTGQVASQAEVLAITNNTRITDSVPAIIERPDSGTITYRVELMLYDEAGNMEAPDSAPTVELVNQSGTDRSSRLDSTTMALVSTGRYRVIYTADVADTLEQLNWTFSVVEGGATRVKTRSSLIVDTTAVDFTAADRTDLQNALAIVDGRLPTALTADGNMKADALRWAGTAINTASIPVATAAGAAGGLHINGSNAGTTTYGALTVTGATTLTGGIVVSAGITITQSTLNGNGISVTGNGSGHGVLIEGGVSGGCGLHIHSATANAVEIESHGANGDAIQLTPAGTGKAIHVVGGGVSITGGLTIDTMAVTTNEIVWNPDWSLQVENATWDGVLASHLDSGSTGAALNAAGSAGDPWGTALPGAYGAGTAGKILGDNLNAQVSEIPTNAEFNARTLPTGEYGTAANQATILTAIDGVPNNAEFNARTLPTGEYGTAANQVTLAAGIASIITITGTSGVEISAVKMNEIADHVRRRKQTAVEASASGDALSLDSQYGAIQQIQKSNTVDNPGFLTVYQSDGTTELGQIALTTSVTAEPVTGVVIQ